MGLYKRSDQFNYYSRPDSQCIFYSDGSDVEDNIFNIIKDVSDKSVLSDELTNKIHDWPTEYHFSKSRHCLLRPLPFKPDDSILELGCGCGAITRYLGEIGADVDSVEGTHSRARVAGERCVDLPNVNIFVDNLLNFESDKRYDWVLFIGVLEYAPLFSNEKDAIQHYLREAKKYLKPNGKLVVAIENKLGLKYFNGCAEDHVNQPYFGIENHYKVPGPVTFGKVELTSILNKAGFNRLDYYYPFPDYKLPNLVIHESAFNQENFSVGELLRNVNSRDYGDRVFRAFSESFVWPELEKNNLVEDFSNSFLVVANNHEISSKGFAWYYNTNRKKNYSTETTFKTVDQEINVEKKSLNQNFKKSKIVTLLDLDEKYIFGCSIQELVENSWHKNRDKEKILDIYKIWLDFVIEHSNYSNDGSVTFTEATVEPRFLDLTPFNVKVGEDGLISFDQEWVWKADVPLLWVIFRGLHWSIHNLNTVHPLEIDIYDEVITLIEKSITNINRDNIGELMSDIISLEKKFIFEVSGFEININSKVCKYPSRYSDLESKNYSLQQEREFIETEMGKLRTQLDKYEKSFPVRMLRNAKRLLKIK